MKKLLNFIFISSALLFISCKSTKVENTAIENKKIVSANTETTTDTDNLVLIESKPINISGMEGKRSFISFGNVEKFFTADPINLFTENAVGTLKQKEALITVYPNEKLVGFGCSYLMAYYYFFVDADNAILLNKAVTKYLSDFENKRLERSKKTIKKYGKAEASLAWGTIKSSTPNNGKGKCDLGYKFVDKSPYFTITFFPIENKFVEKNSAADKSSIMLTFYFTKAQAKELVSYISADNINSIFVEDIEDEQILINKETDIYE